MASKKSTPKQQDLFTPSDCMVIDPLMSELVERCKSVIDEATTHRWLMIADPSRVYEQLSQHVSTTRPATINGFSVDISKLHHRFTTFRRDPVCVCCGRVGNAVLLEIPVNEDRTPTFNMYHVSETEIVQMTVDHIFPDCYGGKYHKSNFQTMCVDCNRKKQHMMSVEEIRAVRRDPTRYVKSWVPQSMIVLVLKMQQAMHERPELMKHLQALSKRVSTSIKHSEDPDMLAVKASTFHRELHSIVTHSKVVQPSGVRRYLDRWSKFYQKSKSIVKRALREVKHAYRTTVGR